jgi:pimeloyl-ACP methyl ester carboxylesterase
LQPTSCADSARSPRLILFDKRGTGLSDRVGGLPNLDDRMDDVRAVMEAVGSSRAALLGVSEGGAMATLFAATYPDRVSALVLYGSYPHHGLWVVTPEQFDAVLKKMDSTWGTDHRVRYFVPGRASDEAFKRWWSRFERLGASPSAAIALMRMNSEIDIRDILPSVRVPTLVLNRAGDLLVNAEAGRYLRDHIPGAKYVELPGNDHWMWAGETNRLADEIEEFLTGTRTTTEPDRVLATVLFTDIVNSTTRARELGDRKWRELLDQHNQVIRRELVRFRGREVKTLGDRFPGHLRRTCTGHSVCTSLDPSGVGTRPRHPLWASYRRG